MPCVLAPSLPTVGKYENKYIKDHVELCNECNMYEI